MPNFESLARKARFNALGRACKDNEIDSLFLAHHQDDQVETVMMRLINGHRGFGLRGMKREGEIPECHGIHGVHESGGMKTTHHKPHASRTVAPLDIEAGGIRVYRPLLGFPKNRLTATCQEANMPWFEDPTNKDPTLTSRNAIRHMYSSHAMPAALTAPSIISLSEGFQTKYERLSKVANSCFEVTTKILEPRTGAMTITFPDLSPLNSSLLPSEAIIAASMVLQQAIQYVTPEEHINLNSLQKVVSRVFPEISDGEPPAMSPAFTISGVQFRPHSPVSEQESDKKEETKPGTYKTSEWMLSRQKYAAKEPKKDILIHPSSNPDATPNWSTWSLFDGRFWIRILNMSGRLISVRPLQKDDLTSLKETIGIKKSKFVHYLLRDLAPADVRWTLPVIVMTEADGTEKALALPSINVRIPEVKELVSWNIRYKKVDTDILKREPAKTIMLDGQV